MTTSKSQQPLGLADNPATRCPVALLLDTSSSMSGSPIDELNRGLELFVQSLQADDVARYAVELTCVTFGDPPSLVLPFTNVADIAAAPRLSASGCTGMGAAIERGLSLLETRKAELRKAGVPYYQPWVVLMTDGAPTDSVVAAAARVRRLCAERKLAFFGIGVGNGADMNTLATICPPDRPPRRLAGLEFNKFFAWLSASVATVSRSSPGQAVNLPPTGGWDSVLG